MPDPYNGILFLQRVRVETYTYVVPGHGTVRWNITAAKGCVASGRLRTPDPVPLPAEEMTNILERCEWDPEHVKVVDPTIPGIAAPFIWNGEIIYVPIDGIHRIARAVQDGLPFSMWLLTDDASRECLIDGPMELIP